MTKEEGKKVIERLVKDFEMNEKHYLSKDFQETEVRNRFIDPFFTALGWDLHQTAIAKSEWDVHREYSQKDNSSTKKPDYAFRTKNANAFKVKFFVEAKAPWVKLTDQDPVYQAKRYAFSSHGKTPIVILTDFQEFRVFNGFQKPIYENPLQGLIENLDFNYREYEDKWDTIWDLFSKDAVISGSIGKLAGTISKKTRTLDQEFLSDISSWRESLAKNIALRNKEASIDELNEAVQRIIDRLVFIRNLEDREIESEGGLLAHTNIKEEVYKHLIPLFRKLDSDYNGLLFKKHFSEDLIIDDKIIKDLIKQMCYPLSPYQFDEIEPEILGRIYEKFLGSKIRLTAGHQAKVEEKIEVRHAGGVYYTPQFVVDYIVENTVGELIKNKTPEEIVNIAICDPACGSGSFLLGAFDYIMVYLKQWYASCNQSAQKKYKADFYRDSDNEIKLTLKKKSEILQQNIFGVDLDREATEVAILSLYLKLLDEGFDKGQVELFMKGHILPDMTNNIKNGNSLISSDYFDGKISFDMNEIATIKPFDWIDEFKERKDGFDCIIGNPPYILIQDLNRDDDALDYYKKNYSSASYKIDTYHLFIEKGLRLLNKNGLLGFITPSNYLTNNGLSKLREVILDNSSIKFINNIIGNVFIDASVDTCITLLSTVKLLTSRFITSKWVNEKLEIVNEKEFQQDIYRGNELNIFTATETVNINTDCFLLGEKYNVNFGMQLRDRKKFLADVITADQKDLITKHHKECYTGKDISRYHLGYSNLLAYVNREAKSGGCWDEKAHETRPKVLVRQIGERPICALDENGWYSLNTLFLITPKSSDELSVKYILGILNSNYIGRYWENMFSDKRKTFPKIKGTYLEKLPIPNISKENQAYLDIVNTVEAIINVKKQQITSKSTTEQQALEKQENILNKKLDTVVNNLYGE